jgi:hypothetical protein
MEQLEQLMVQYMTGEWQFYYGTRLLDCSRTVANNRFSE